MEERTYNIVAMTISNDSKQDLKPKKYDRVVLLQLPINFQVQIKEIHKEFCLFFPEPVSLIWQTNNLEDSFFDSFHLIDQTREKSKEEIKMSTYAYMRVHPYPQVGEIGPQFVVFVIRINELTTVMFFSDTKYQV